VRAASLARQSDPDGPNHEFSGSPQATETSARRRARTGRSFGGETGIRKMTTQVIEKESTNAITSNGDAAANILNAAKEDAAFDKILKFRKGDYFVSEDPVPLGSEYLAHAASWVKAWIKFADGKVVDRKLYRVALGERPPQREELDSLDENEWPIGRDGKRIDPWVFQYLLPLENMTSGDVVVFVTGSIGGRQAVSDLCKAYANRKLSGKDGQPVIQLAVGEMPTKNFGKVPRPLLEIVAWDNAESAFPEASLAAAIPVQPRTKKAADDEIPF
jgi:hypothetical protein